VIPINFQTAAHEISGLPDVISLDMGGTGADVALIRNYTAGTTFIKDRGLSGTARRARHQRGRRRRRRASSQHHQTPKALRNSSTGRVRSGRAWIGKTPPRFASRRWIASTVDCILADEPDMGETPTGPAEVTRQMGELQPPPGTGPTVRYRTGSLVGTMVRCTLELAEIAPWPAF